MTENNLLHVTVRDSQKILFDQDVDRISSYNEMGAFDIYPLHANFISIIQKDIIFFHANRKVKELKIEKAILKVKKNQVHIFLGIEAFALEKEEGEV